METQRLFDEMNMYRGYFIKTIDGLSGDQLTGIPNGFSNNILWNAGHIAWSQAAIVYSMGGLEAPVPASYKDYFDNGTNPSAWTSTPDIEEVKSNLKSLCDSIVADHAAGKFGERQPFNVGGLDITTFEEAMSFNAWHEGIHLGTILAIKRCL